MRSRLFYVAMAIVMGTIGLVAALALDGVQEMAADLDQTEADNAKINAELNEQESASQALAEQVKRLGGKPVVDPPAVTPSQGERGPGPTASQVRAAVADYCAGDRCKPTVSRAQVAAAVADYCAGGACQGRPGAADNGTDGTNGATGATGPQGPQGPGPTADQIAAAVEAYCADGKCRGEKGETGDTGPAGEDATFTPSGMDCPEGERVNGVHLLADGSLTVSCAPLIGRD